MDAADLQIPEAPRPGDEVGAYRLIDELGAGGMGKVFLAEHRKLGRRVALKILQPELWHNRRSVQRFFQEAKLVNRIDHENIVEIYDYIQEADGLSYLIMELLIGADLTQTRAREGPFGLERAVPILRQVAAALTAAHHGDVVHRDLKPANIFLVQKGSRRDFVKLLDFGIAKLQDAMNLDGPHTRTGAVVGTPVYMSPEQANGDKVDARSDIYSLGVVAYWMLSDSFPFKAKSFAELLQKQASEPAPELPRWSARNQPLPEALARLVHRCLERNPAARYQSADEVEAELTVLAKQYDERTPLVGDSLAAGRTPALPPPIEPPLPGATVILNRAAPSPAQRRSGALSGVILTLVGALLAAATYAAWRALPADELPPPKVSPPPVLAVPRPAAPEPVPQQAATAAPPLPQPPATETPATPPPETAAAEKNALANRTHEAAKSKRPGRSPKGSRPAASRSSSADEEVLDPFSK